jgi:hypothetical protein
MTASTAEGSSAPILDVIRPFVNAGWAVHWLHPRKKRPIGDDWPNKPVATYDDLVRSYRAGNNVGVRLGEPSRLPLGFLHVIDMDIRDASLAAEAWAALVELFPAVDFLTYPSVVSGSGGESRHLYFICPVALKGKTLARSTTFKMVFDPEKGRDVRKSDWEIELFGTGKQVAMPPSIHPDTGLPYLWERPFDLDALEFGIGPIISDADAEYAGIIADERDDGTHNTNRFGMSIDEAREILNDLPLDDWCEIRQGWLDVAMALKHEFGDDGFALWDEFSKQSKKYDVRTQRSVWKSIRNRTNRPIRMATLLQAAKEVRRQSWFDEVDGFDDVATYPSVPSIVAELSDNDLLGGLSAPVSPSTPATGADDIDNIGTPGNETRTLKWDQLLDYVDGKPSVLKPTLHNLELIIKNDPRLVGLPQLNEFTQETVQRRQPGHRPPSRANAAKPWRQLTGPVWEVKDPVNGVLWSSARDYAVRCILEAPRTQGGYGIKVADRDQKAATVLAAWESCFHPIREYLTGLTWDGRPRVDNLWIKYVHATDDAYHRETARLMMVAAVARIFEPGAKFDFCTVLEGLQGKRKSTLIRILGRHRWFGDPDFDFTDQKKMVENMQGVWICEAPELTGFKPSEVRRIKSFISRQTDRVRLAYEARAAEYPRQSVIIATTNDTAYLHDTSGGRRFWPVKTQLSLSQEIDTDLLESEIDQMWAEAVAVYRQMREAQPSGELPLYLRDPDAIAVAIAVQESRRVESDEDMLVGQIQSWLERPVMSGDFDDASEGKPRVVTCLIEIATECFGMSVAEYQKTKFCYPLGRAMKRVPGWNGPGKQAIFSKFDRQRSYERAGRILGQLSGPAAGAQGD